MGPWRAIYQRQLARYSRRPTRRYNKSRREYRADLLNRGVEQVIALGLALRGKEAAVAYATLTDAS
ncbi:MAG: hypothetical protein AAF471_01885 [Myxococcota bacterium]